MASKNNLMTGAASVTPVDIDAQLDILAQARVDGEKSMFMLGEAVAKWARVGAIKIAEKKNDPDDVAKILTQYWDKVVAKDPDLRSETNISSEESRIRAYGKLGKISTIVPSDFIARVKNVRNKLGVGKVKPVYFAVASACSAQVKAGSILIPESTIKEAVRKAVAKKSDQTLTGAWERILASVSSLIEGKNNDLQDDSTQAVDIKRLIQNRIKAAAKEEKEAEAESIVAAKKREKRNETVPSMAPKKSELIPASQAATLLKSRAKISVNGAKKVQKNIS